MKVNSKKIAKSLPKVKKISLADTFESAPMPNLQVPAPPVAEAPIAVEALPEPVKIALQAPQFLQKNRVVSLKDNTKVKFSWNSVPDATKYILEISSNLKFQNPTVIETTETNFISKPAQAGLSFFRMQAVAPDFFNSEYSDVKIVKTKIPPIIVDRLRIEDAYNARSPADEGTSKQFPVTWNSIPTAKSYVIEVSQNFEFTNPVSNSVSEPAGQLEVPQTGSYFYRISALNKAGRQISSMPTIGEIVYKKIDQISGPLISSASKRLSYYFQKEYGQFIWLRWKANQPTSNYRLEISKNANFKKINFSFATADTKYLIKSKIPEGEYFWRVRSETLTSTLQPSAWSEVATLKIQTK